MQLKAAMVGFAVMLPSFLQRSTIGLPTLALVCTVVSGCGGDLPGRYPPGPFEPVDGGGLCWSQGQQVSCDCRTETVSVAVALGFSGSGTLNDAAVDFVRLTGATASVALPAKGSATANRYMVASLRNAAGSELATVALADPRTSGSASRTSLVLAAPATPAVLHVENWGTGQVIVDLDLRGHVQLLCIDRPCLTICSAGGIDGGSSAPMDASAVDAGIVDAPASIDAIDAGGVD